MPFHPIRSYKLAFPAMFLFFHFPGFPGRQDYMPGVLIKCIRLANSFQEKSKPGGRYKRKKDSPHLGGYSRQGNKKEMESFTL